MPTPALFDLKSLFVAVETETGKDPSPDGSGYFPLYAQEIAFGPTQEAIERPLQRHSLTKLGPLAGAKGGTLTFGLEVRGSGVAPVADRPAATAEADIVLEAVFGIRRIGRSCTAAAGWTPTGGAVTGAAPVVGDHVMIEGAIRQVIAVDGLNVTLNRPLPSAPAAGELVAGAVNYAPKDTGNNTLAFVVTQGDQQWTLTGCAGTVVLEGAAAGGRPLLKFTFQVDDWVPTTKTALPPIDPVAWPKGAPVLGAELSYGDSALLVSEFGFDLGNEVQGVPATVGVNGRAGFVLVGRSATGTIKPFYARGPIDDFRSGAPKHLSMPIGSAPGNAMVVSIGAAVVSALPTIENVNSQLYSAVGFMPIATGTLVPDISLAVF